MTRFLCVALAGLAITGCASVESPMDDGYQVGDLTDTVITLQAQYCATANPTRRALLLASMRAAGVPVPPSGACTDLLSLIDPEDLADIDTEQAEEDQRRFQERDDADADPAVPVD